MKQMIRAVTLVLLVGGWSLAGSAVYVVRTPTSFAIVPKDRLAFHDTYVDTRKWTVADDQSHPAVVARLVHLGRGDLLDHTLPSDTADAAGTLAAIAAQQPVPGVATSTAAGTLMKSAEGQIKSVVDLAKDKAGKI